MSDVHKGEKEVPTSEGVPTILLTSNKRLANAVERAAKYLWKIEVSTLIEAQPSQAEVLEYFVLSAGEGARFIVDSVLATVEQPDAEHFSGVEIFKHARLMVKAQIWQAPMTVICPESIGFHIERSIDNLLLNAPGTHVWSPWTPLDALRQTLETPPIGGGQASLRPFIVVTNAEHHQHANTGGVERLAKELGMTTMLKKDEAASFSVPLLDRKKEILASASTAGEEPSDWKPQGHSYRRYLLIDDLHEHGWSQALRRLLSLEDDDSRLECRGDPASAHAWIDDQHNKRQKIINVLAKAEPAGNPRFGFEPVDGCGDQDMEDALGPDVVFLDLRLLKEEGHISKLNSASGLDILKRLRDKLPELPVIVLTASTKAYAAQEALRLGAVGYWIKNDSSASDLRHLVDLALRMSDLRCVSVWQKILSNRLKTNNRGAFKITFSPSSRTHRFERMHKDAAGVCSNLLHQTRDIILRQALSYWGLPAPHNGYEFKEGQQSHIRNMIINLGLVQEFRIPALNDDRSQERCEGAYDFNFLARTDPVVARFEKNLRKVRNFVVHPRAGSRPDPRQFFWATWLHHTYQQITGLYMPTTRGFRHFYIGQPDDGELLISRLVGEYSELGLPDRS